MGKFKKSVVKENAFVPHDTSFFKVEEVHNGIKNGHIEAKKRKVPTVPDGFPMLHSLFGFFGQVRSGKTYAMVNLTKAYIDAGVVNMSFCITPSYESNTILHTIPFEKDGIYSDEKTAPASLKVILGKIKKRNDEYEYEKEYKKCWKAWLKDEATQLQEIILYKEQYRDPISIPWPVPCKYLV